MLYLSIPTKNITSTELVDRTKGVTAVRGIETWGGWKGLVQAQNRAIGRRQGMVRAMPQETPDGSKYKSALPLRDVTRGVLLPRKGLRS